MTSRQRDMRRAALFALMMWVVPALIRFDYGRLTQLAELVASASARPPAPAAAAPLTMTAQVLEQQLRLAPVSGGAPRDHRCVPGAPGFNGWDYVCSYTVGETLAARRMKIGVRVTATAIVQASAPYPFEHVLPAASQAGGAY